MQQPKVTTTLHLTWLDHRVLTRALHDAKAAYMRETEEHEKAGRTVNAKRTRNYVACLDVLLRPFEAAYHIEIEHIDLT